MKRDRDQPERQLGEDEMELLKQTQREIDECMGSGRYEEAQEFRKLIKSQFSTDATGLKQEHPSIPDVLRELNNFHGSTHDLFKQIGSMARDFFDAYDVYRNIGLQKLRESTDEDGETDEMSIARRIFRHIPENIIDFLIKLLRFFPFFRMRYGHSSIDDTLRLRTILWVYNELKSNAFDLKDRWLDADSPIDDSFHLYLQSTFTNDI